MAVLSLNNISKAYGTDIILKEITFTINENDKIGMVGKNGAGKTTLFKIICGELKPDTGDIFIAKDIKLGYLSQNLNLNDDSTVFEEVMKVFEDTIKIEQRLRELEIEISHHSLNSEADIHQRLLKEYGQLQDEFERKNGYGCESFAKGILVGLGIPETEFNKKIHLLSGGQKTRVALSKMLLEKPDILLLDEPTNHLDLDAINFLENFLKDYKGTIIIISHDRFFLDVITNKTYEIADGTIEEYPGNYTYYVNERETRYEQRVKEYSLQQAEIKRMEEIIQKYRSFNREKSIKQAESREKALNKIQRIEKPTLDNKSARILFDIRVRSGNDVLMIENLSKHYGEKKLFEDISFMLRREERIALIGENGRGKTTIFKIIMEDVKPDNGYVRLGKNVHIGYYDQEQKNLSPEKTIIDELWDEYPDMTATQIRNYLAAFLFTGDDVFKEISKLSGGEKCRISLLKLMLSNANLLLLDEPTNHLDILSREALEKALLEYPGTLFIISHDRYFLNKIIGKIYELNSDGITEYLGNYQYYISKKNAPKDEIVIDTVGKTKTEIRDERKKLRATQQQRKQLQNEIKQTEKDIESAESDIAKLEEQLCLEEIYSNPEKCIEINNTLKSLRDTINTLYEKWEEVSLELEE